VKFSASKAALLAKCRYPFREAEEMDRWGDSEDSRFGRALHKCGEVWVKTHTYPDVVLIAREYDVEDQLPRMLRVWKHMLAWLETFVGNDAAFAELKMAVDLEKRRAWAVTTAGVRDYGDLKAPFQFGMTLDLLMPGGSALVGADMPLILDWKTGHTSEGYWGQIGLNALAVAWCFGVSQVRGGLLHATEDGVSHHVRTFKPLEIEAIASDTYDLLDEVGNAAPNPGPHCTELRCGAFGRCPETQGVLTKMDSLLPANENGRSLTFTPNDAEEAAYVLHRLKTYEALAKQLKAGVAHFVDGKEWRVEGGILKETYRNVNRTSVSDLIALARAKGATDEEIASCSYSNRESAGIRILKG